MIKKYFIDGNNLIGKSNELKEVQKRDPQASREKLAFKLDRFFLSKGFEVVLFLDGHPGDSIPTQKIKVVYSYNRTADNCIRDEIERDKSPKTIAVVSSDLEIISVARANSCKPIKSEEFWASFKRDYSMDEESEIQKSISEDEIRRLFDVDGEDA